MKTLWIRRPYLNKRPLSVFTPDRHPARHRVEGAARRRGVHVQGAAACDGWDVFWNLSHVYIIYASHKSNLKDTNLKDTRTSEQ